MPKNSQRRDNLSLKAKRVQHLRFEIVSENRNIGANAKPLHFFTFSVENIEIKIPDFFCDYHNLSTFAKKSRGSALIEFPFAYLIIPLPKFD